MEGIPINRKKIYVRRSVAAHAAERRLLLIWEQLHIISPFHLKKRYLRYHITVPF